MVLRLLPILLLLVAHWGTEEGRYAFYLGRNICHLIFNYIFLSAAVGVSLCFTLLSFTASIIFSQFNPANPWILLQKGMIGDIFILFVCSVYIYIYIYMNKLLILTSYAKFELNSLRNNEITVKLLITDIFGCRDTAKVRNDVIFKQWLWRHELFC